jgi:hypothetical protein
VTNAFHLPRTRAIFDAVFALPLSSAAAAAAAPAGGGGGGASYALAYLGVPNDGLAPETLAARRAKEAGAAAAFARTLAQCAVHDLAGLHAWLFTEVRARRAR